MIVLVGLFPLVATKSLVNSANTIPNDPLSIGFFILFPLLSVVGLMRGTSQMYQARSSQQGRFIHLLGAFVYFGGSVSFLMVWHLMFFQLK